MRKTRALAIGVSAGILAMGFVLGGQAGWGSSVRASGPCEADSVILGPLAELTGPTPTDWFNVFGIHLDPTVPAVVTFDVPVIPWSLEQPKVVQAAVSTFTIPSAHSTESFKWTFRARDPGVQAIRATVSGPGCEAVTRIDFSPPATSTIDVAPDPGEGGTFGLGSVLFLVFGGALLAAHRRLARRGRQVR
jgi:hypothetical protein